MPSSSAPPRVLVAATATRHERHVSDTSARTNHDADSTEVQASERQSVWGDDSARIVGTRAGGSRKTSSATGGPEQNLEEGEDGRGGHMTERYGDQGGGGTRTLRHNVMFD